MSTETVNQQSIPETPTFAMLRTLGSAATISGLLIVLAYKITLPYIEENQRLATEAAVFNVLPQAVTQLSFTVTPEGLQRSKPGLTGEVIYAVYDKSGVLQGVALPGSGQGYADQIKILYAYKPDCHCITGVKVLKMAETPGIGDKVITDQNFVKNFESLDANLNTAGDGLANSIVAVRHGTKTEPWQIDAISGATISSRGMAKGLNDSANRLLPLIQKHLAILQAGLAKP